MNVKDVDERVAESLRSPQRSEDLCAIPWRGHDFGGGVEGPPRARRGPAFTFGLPVVAARLQLPASTCRLPPFRFELPASDLRSEVEHGAGLGAHRARVRELGLERAGL